MEVSLDNDDFCENVLIIENDESDTNVAPESKRRRSTRRTDLQLEKLKSFMTKNPDFTQGQADEKLLLAWDNLTTELNSMGPPIHSSIAWRKKWSDYKACQKRKHPSSNVTLPPNENDVDDKDLREAYKYDLEAELLSHEDEETIHSPHRGILKKLDLVVEQQIQTNDLLKKLIEIFETQSVLSS